MLTVTAADTVIKRQNFNQPALDKSLKPLNQACNVIY